MASDVHLNEWGDPPQGRFSFGDGQERAPSGGATPRTARDGAHTHRLERDVRRFANPPKGREVLRQGESDVDSTTMNKFGPPGLLPFSKLPEEWRDSGKGPTRSAPSNLRRSPGREPDLFVFSHLRWDFVFQRPQQILTRLSRHRRVFFVEEPVHDVTDPWMEYQARSENVLICRPHTRGGGQGFTPDQVRSLRPLLESLLDGAVSDDHVVWFYTPLAFPLIDVFNPLAVVYDCMDELSAFLGAPAGLKLREAELIAGADVVFTGGPSLHRAKQDLNPNTHCFPSSVDAAHFAQARQGASVVDEAPDQASLPAPRLGYYGVIDERLDLAVVEHLARVHPEWQIVMVGPVAKIDPATLPQMPNIHWFGARDYQKLPAYVSGWDVCLMPFVLAEATETISPTKVLEYMASGRPIVSSAIRDVEEPYGAVVRIADGPEGFVEACEQALAETDDERAARTKAMDAIVGATSWDRTTEAMRRLVDLATRGSGAIASEIAAESSRVVVVGAGPTGLSAAYHLGSDAVLLERNDRVGGWCRSIVDGGFTFDHAGHIMFSNDTYVLELYEKLLGGNVHWQDREAWIYSKGVYSRYPFQGALYGLPSDVIKECLVGAIEARLRSLAPGPRIDGGIEASLVDRQRHAADAPTDGCIDDCCADGVLEATASLSIPHEPIEPTVRGENFEEFIYRVWGDGIAKHFAIPYNRKLWAVDLREMETSWLGGRVPMPDIEELIEGSLGPSSKPVGPNARFGYPLRGGFQALMDGFLPSLEGPLHLGAEVVAVSPSRHIVGLGDGRSFRYEQLISTMPLPVLVRLMGEEAPSDVHAAAEGLRHVSVRCVNLGVGRENLTDKHWIYYPEESVFHRIFVQGNASPHCNPPGGFALTCEITYSEHKPLPCDGAELIDRCIEDCRKVGILQPEDPILVANQVDMPYAYVVYDHERRERVAHVRGWLEARDIVLAGRYSEWEYYNSDHAFLAGRRAAEECLQRLAGPMPAAG